MLFLKATSLHPGLLVPNLRVLSWHTCISPDEGSPALSIVFIQQLLNPSLVSLNVTLIDQEDGTLQSFLANYAFLCPNLKSVTVNLGCMQMSRTAVQALSRSITHHTHLERLKLSTPVDHVALTHIAMSPKLKELSLVLHPERSNLHQVRIPSNTIPFPNVMDLKLQVWNLHFVTTLLRTEDQMFRSVVICRRYRPTIKAAFALFAILASQQRARSLQSITLISDFLDVQSRRFPPPELDDVGTRDYLSYDTFRPLSSLRQLRHLILDLGHWFSLDDDDLVSLARNWPSLQTLQLGCGERVYEYPWRSTKYITFKGLLSLLGCCPDLYDLSLPLDARQVPVDTGDVVCNPALTLLRLLEPPIDNVRSVRDILARHFPSVREVIISFDQSSEDGDAEYALYVELWDEVNILLENTHASHHDDSES
ncbi:hypothetical protein V8E55_008038 [Tylopilus felleus]